MKKAIKWVSIAAAAIVALIVIAVLVIPAFVDLQKYKPKIEQLVSEATGRPFAIVGEIDLSLFPWVGFSAADIHLGNAPGFQEKDLASVESVEVRVKLIPLISREVQLKKFIVQSPRLVIEKDRKGRSNLEGLGKPSTAAPAGPQSEKESALPIKDLAVGEFAITNGSVLWIDHGTGQRRQVSEFSLEMQDVLLDQPIPFKMAVKLDGRPIAAQGQVGPVGNEPGKGAIPIDVQITALKELALSVKGQLVDPAADLRFDLAVQLSPFSPRSVFKAFDQEFPVQTADPAVLSKIAFQSAIAGNPNQISISNGILQIDDSKLQFSAQAKDFSKPDLTFSLDLDRIDLDRYLPPPSETPAGAEQQKAPVRKEPTDYTPLRKLVLNGAAKIGGLKVHGAKIERLSMKIAGRNGVFDLNPLALELYQGTVSSKGVLDVRKNKPETKMAVQASGIMANPLLKDLLQKDVIEGTLTAALDIAMSGDDAAAVKQTLTGKGDVKFADGAVVGIDLAGMVRNATTAFGLSEPAKERPRTDFSELQVPFTIRQGVVNTLNTSLTSPLLRVQAAGKADLVKESLDFRIEPKFVATIVGQGDTRDRTGITVPVLVAGSFDKPTFRPDLENILRGTLEKGISDPDALKKILPGQKGQDGKPKSAEDTAKDVLKGFLKR